MAIVEGNEVSRGNAPEDRHSFEQPASRGFASADDGSANSHWPSGELLPTAAAPPANLVLQRDLRLSIGDGTMYGVMVGGGESYLQAFVLAVGLGEVFAGLVATVPVLIGSLLQLISPRAVRFFGSHKRWVVVCSLLQAACFLPLISAAWGGHISAMSAMLISSVYWGASLGTGPAWNTWQGTIIPRPLRAKFFAKRSRLCQATTLVGFLAAGFALEAGKADGNRVAIFAVLFGVSCVCRILSSACLAFQSEPTPIPEDMRFLTPREQWQKFSRGPSGRLLLFAVSMQVGVYVAGPFFVPYMLKELHFAYTDYAILIGASFVAKFVCLPWWGRLAHRTGAQRLLWIGAVGIIPLAGGWAVSSNYWWLLSLQLLAGASWGAYELALVLLFFETIPESERTSLLTLYNVANSAALAVGSLIGAALLQTVGISVTGYLTVFAASTLLRLVTMVLLRRIPTTNVLSAAVPVRPLSVRSSGESLGAPILPGLPDQTSEE